MDGFASPVQLISGRRFRSTLPINSQLLKVKPINGELFVKRRQQIPKKQIKNYNQHTKPLKVLHKGEKIRMFNGMKWKLATVLYHSKERRSYIVKNGDGDVHRRKRKNLLKTGEGDIVKFRMMMLTKKN